jgi:hypothetical protein
MKRYTDERKVKIWFQTLDDEGNVIGTGVYHKEYSYYGTAHNMAHKLYGGKKNIKYDIGILNPFVDHFTDAVCDICGETYSQHVDAHFGLSRPDHCVSIHSSVIPPEDGRKRYYKYHHTCPKCIVRINNFVNSLREGNNHDIT